MAKVGSAEIDFDIDTKGFETQIAQTEEELNKLVRAFETTKNMKPYKGQEEDLKEISLNLEKVKNKLVSLKAQQEKIDYGDSSNQLEKHDKSLSKIIAKVGKWALAVFGLRSMYNFVRQSASTIGQYDKQIGADLEYIRYALAFTLKPVIEWLVKAVYTILKYVGAIIYRLTGYNIFKNSGAKQYEKSLKSSEKSSKKIKDNFSASFDEFQKVEKQDTSSDSSSGGIGMPSQDLSDLSQIELPKWLTKIIDFIKEHKGLVLGVVGALLSLLTFNKAIGWLSPLQSFFGGLGGVVGKLGLIAGSIAVIGISAKTWYDGNVKQKEKLNELNKQGIEYSKEDAKNFSNIDEMSESLNYKRKKGNELLKKSTSWSAALTMTGSELEESVKGSVEQQDNYLQEQIKNYRQGKLTKEEQDKLKDILYGQVDYLVDIGDELDRSGKNSEYIHKYTSKYRDILKEMGEPQGPLAEMNDFFDKIWQRSDKAGENTKNAVDNMLELINTNIPDKEMKVDVKADTKNANKSLAELALGLANTLTAPLKAFGLNALANNILTRVKGIKWAASGAIINQPGRGVPIGNVIGGEAGREGILPLTDSRAMAELGQEIGKWVNINNVVNNYVDGRRLNQLLAKSQNRDDFARNGG